MMNLLKNKKVMSRKGAFTDLFIFLIVAFTLLLISGMYIFMAGELKEQLHTLDSVDSEVNYTEIVDDTFGDVVIAYQSLYWISIFIIISMVISIFIGNYIITTRPVFFVPYIFIVIIATVVSVGISNAYNQIASTDNLRPIFEGFLGSNFIMAYLPLWVVAIGFVGGIVMFVRMKQEEYIA